jgi:hypothetical protein
MDSHERKMLAILAILLPTFAEMIESEEGKQEFVKVLELMRKRIEEPNMKVDYAT